MKLYQIFLCIVNEIFRQMIKSETTTVFYTMFEKSIKTQKATLKLIKAFSSDIH